MTLLGCVQIPNLAIALARRDDPALVDRPLVMYTTDRARPTVYAASPETGATPSMPLKQALLRSPDVVCRPADLARERQAAAALTDLLACMSPRVAATAHLPDLTIMLDLGRARLPQALALTQQMAARIRVALDLRPAIGMATTQFVAARAASVAGAGAAVVVPPGQERTFLAPQPITALPIAAEVIRRLHLLGLRTLGAVAAIPRDALAAQFGAVGFHIHCLAQGMDDQPVARLLPTLQLAHTRRFNGPLSDRTFLEQAITILATRLATDLEAGGHAAKAVTLTLSVEDGEPITVCHTLVEATANGALLVQALLRLSRQAPLHNGIEAVTVAAADLSSTVATQRDLFSPAQGQADRLRDVLGRLSPRHARSVLRVTLSDPHARLPERRVRFDPLELP
jgi:nucleotidyltransferase/DNA polymerase involved in DNA repair